MYDLYVLILKNKLENVKLFIILRKRILALNIILIISKIIYWGKNNWLLANIYSKNSKSKDHKIRFEKKITYLIIIS